jgi:cell division protein ZapD
MTKNSIVYEYPTHELTRICLRLELLFDQIDQELQHPLSLERTRRVTKAIIDILNVLDRPDLKSKLTKELRRYVSALARLENVEGIDGIKLTNTLKDLENLMEFSINTIGKYGDSLRHNEFLKSLKLQLAIPGGACHFDMPAYYFWLNQNPSTRLATIKAWLIEFAEIRHAMTLLLKLTREGAKTESQEVSEGFFQAQLDPQSSMRLIRIEMPSSTNVYPDISIGRHLLTVRFYSLNLDGRPIQNKGAVDFSLGYCHG